MKTRLLLLALPLAAMACSSPTAPVERRSPRALHPHADAVTPPPPPPDTTGRGGTIGSGN
ncbi:MAG TPA: hypothetical protein VEW03_08225 [Longimicrobiaceae bacterium]|nr:hypothetical protein [Longimicrobiaceae bacterium]